jgi:hypothetical protein
MIQMKNFINTLSSSIRHRSELVQHEAPATHAKPLLQKEDRTRAAQFHSHDDGQQERAQQD